MTYYKLIMTYPGGRVEEVDETFSTLEAAVEYGRQLNIQAQANTEYRDKGSFFVKKTKSSYVVVKHDDNESKIVFDSSK